MGTLSRKSHSIGAWSKVVRTVAFVQLLWFLYSSEFMMAVIVAPIVGVEYLTRKMGAGRGMERYDS